VSPAFFPRGGGVRTLAYKLTLEFFTNIITDRPTVVGDCVVIQIWAFLKTLLFVGDNIWYLSLFFKFRFPWQKVTGEPWFPGLMLKAVLN
jgi:hypothetical protein